MQIKEILVEKRKIRKKSTKKRRSKPGVNSNTRALAGYGYYGWPGAGGEVSGGDGGGGDGGG